MMIPFSFPFPFLFHYGMLSAKETSVCLNNEKSLIPLGQFRKKGRDNWWIGCSDLFFSSYLLCTNILMIGWMGWWVICRDGHEWRCYIVSKCRTLYSSLRNLLWLWTVSSRRVNKARVKLMSISANHVDCPRSNRRSNVIYFIPTENSSFSIQDSKLVRTTGTRNGRSAVARTGGDTWWRIHGWSANSDGAAAVSCPLCSLHASMVETQ